MEAGSFMEIMESLKNDHPAVSGHPNDSHFNFYSFLIKFAGVPSGPNASKRSWMTAVIPPGGQGALSAAVTAKNV